MTWEEYVELSRTLIAFNSLTPEDKERIMLMMDGLKYRRSNERESEQAQGID